MKTSIAFISEAKGNNQHEKSIVFRTDDPQIPFVRVLANELPQKEQTLQGYRVDPANIFKARASVDHPGQVYGGVKAWLATAIEKKTATCEPLFI